VDANRKLWNEQHKLLRQALAGQGDHAAVIGLFLRQHAMVHDGEMSNSGLPSFADEVWQDASEADIRCVPPKGEHSIAWLVWHIARIEDMTMNVLLAGKTQVFHRANWMTKMNITVRHTGNVVMDTAAVVEFSRAVDIAVLRGYRLAVGCATREAVMGLRPEDIQCRVDPARLQGLLDDGSVAPEATGLIEYWGNLTIGGLLLMPPTRHCLVHLNEALKVKKIVSKLTP
jgi:hypothetical protein